MFDTHNIFNQLLVVPILNVLMGLYNGLLYLHLPGALGLSLILLTIIIRLILHPLTVQQLRSTQKLSKLKPQLDKLTAQYKNDKTKLQQEQMKLYKDAGINPAAGCLPLLIQMPILIALYNMFFRILNSAGNQNLIVSEINKVVYAPFLKINSLDLNFFGISLTHKPNEWQKIGWWLLLIPIVTGGLQYIQTKMMTPSSVPQSGTTAGKASSLPIVPVPKNASKEVKEAAKEVKQEEDMAVTMQKQMAIMMPAMIGFFAYSFPLGLSLYWNTFTIFGIIQQYIIKKETN